MTDQIEGYPVAPPDATPDITKQPEKAKQESKQESKSNTDNLLEAIPALKRNQVERWQGMYGKIYAVVLDEDEIFIYRSFTRIEYRAMMQTIQESSKREEVDKEDLFDELVVQKCLLWPTIGPDFGSTSKGGTIPTLAQAISFKSHFIPPQAVLASIIALD